MEDLKLKVYLENHSVRYSEYKHPPVHTVAESDSEPSIKSIPGVRGKTLFLKDNLGKFYLIGVPVHKRIDFKKIEMALKIKKIKMASPEELLEETNLTPGSVSIFGAINNPKVCLILDCDIWEAKETGFHPNKNTSTLVINHESLEKFYYSLINEKRII